jgi:hypothetical protein
VEEANGSIIIFDFDSEKASPKKEAFLLVL